MFEEDYRILCRNIRYLRKAHHLNQKDMAKLLGIGVGSLRRLERGELPVGIRLSMFNHIFDEFGVLPSVLLETDLEDTAFSG